MGVGVEKVKLPSAFLLARSRPPFFSPFFLFFFFYGCCIAVPFFVARWRLCLWERTVRFRRASERLENQSSTIKSYLS